MPVEALAEMEERRALAALLLQVAGLVAGQELVLHRQDLAPLRAAAALSRPAGISSRQAVFQRLLQLHYPPERYLTWRALNPYLDQGRQGASAMVLRALTVVRAGQAL
ncbi:hypothetical protein EMIT0347P_130030 [Pseudomonas sp. IT-347P]